MTIIRLFLLLPFGIRAAFFLLIVLLLWRLLGKKMIWILSIIPFLLDRAFILLYQLIEWPISILHKKCGGIFYAIDNFIAGVGKRVDEFLRLWYDLWHSQYNFKLGRALVIYIICFAFIVGPSFLPIDNTVLKSGERIYLSAETLLENFLERHDIVSSKEAVTTGQSEEFVVAKEEGTAFQIEMVVTGVSSSLLVRDIPDIKNATTLDRLSNGDRVIWTGGLIFAETENNQVEAWIKVSTDNDVEGWSRLNYLCPEDYEDIEYYIGTRDGK